MLKCFLWSLWLALQTLAAWHPRALQRRLLRELYSFPRHTGRRS